MLMRRGRSGGGNVGLGVVVVRVSVVVQQPARLDESTTARDGTGLADGGGGVLVLEIAADKLFTRSC